jgi:hypothetical protein
MMNGRQGLTLSPAAMYSPLLSNSTAEITSAFCTFSWFRSPKTWQNRQLWRFASIQKSGAERSAHYCDNNDGMRETLSPETERVRWTPSITHFTCELLSKTSEQNTKQETCARNDWWEGIHAWDEKVERMKTWCGDGEAAIRMPTPSGTCRCSELQRRRPRLAASRQPEASGWYLWWRSNGWREREGA